MTNNECQKDPIFLLQKRKYILTKIPEWLGHDDAGFWVELDNLPDYFSDFGEFMERGEVNDKKLYKYLCQLSDDDCQYCVETWTTDSVWLSRGEAEQWGGAKSYNFPDGWRVFCVSAMGMLACVLRDLASCDRSKKSRGAIAQ